jgi:hypothetical protein
MSTTYTSASLSVDASPDTEALMFRAKILVGPYSNGEDRVQFKGYALYGKVRDNVGLARGDATRMYKDTIRYRVPEGTEVIKTLEACIPVWKVVETSNESTKD